jgi:hypothetical protein
MRVRLHVLACLVDSAKFENPLRDRKGGAIERPKTIIVATWPQLGRNLERRADVTNRGQDCIALGPDLVLPKGRKSS